MAGWSGFWLAIWVPWFTLQVSVQDPARIQFQEALAAPGGLDNLVQRLDDAARKTPSSPVLPAILETIQLTAIFHPGLVSDSAQRFETMKSAAAKDPAIAGVVKRLELLQGYYAAATSGKAEEAAGTLDDPVLQGWPPALHARADAALRARNYASAEAIALQVIESDPYSPLLADMHMVIGFSQVFRGRAVEASREFQRALALTGAATVYGDSVGIAETSYRFSRPEPAAIGGIFREVSATDITGIRGLDDPRSLIFRGGKFLLADKEQIITIGAGGAATSATTTQRLNDLADSGRGTVYSLAEDYFDPGGGKWIKFSYETGGRTRTLGNLQSLAVAAGGDVFLTDSDAGLLKASRDSDAWKVVQVAPIKGRQVRIDSRGFLYVLAWDRRSLAVLSREGKVLSTLAPAPIGGKNPEIEFFALDALNHVYLLDDGSDTIQVYAMNEGDGGLEAVSTGVITLEARPQNKNLRVLAVSSAGEVAVTGKNEDKWILYR